MANGIRWIRESSHGMTFEEMRVVFMLVYYLPPAASSTKRSWLGATTAFVIPRRRISQRYAGLARFRCEVPIHAEAMCAAKSDEFRREF